MAIQLYREIENQKPIKLKRAAILISLAFFLVSLNHLTFFINSSHLEIVTLLILYTPIFIFITFFLKDSTYLHLPSTHLILIFWTIGLIGKLTSRYDYIETLIAVRDVYTVRRDETLSQGGWYSYLSIFFYPSFILLLISSIKYKFNTAFYLVSLALLLSDLLLLSMRMVPMFIMFIWSIIYISQTPPRKAILRGLLLFFIFIPVFMVTTENKSYAGSNMDWGMHLEETISTQVVKFKPEILEAEMHQLGSAALFLSHYLYHSVGEFSNYLRSDYLNHSDINSYRLFNEFSPITSNSYSEKLKEIDPRYGVYKTLYYSLISDFGVIGFLFLIIPSMLLLALLFKCNRYNSLHILILGIILLSPIENFIYTGLGLLQFSITALIVICSFLLQTRPRPRTTL